MYINKKDLGISDVGNIITHVQTGGKKTLVINIALVFCFFKQGKKRNDTRVLLLLLIKRHHALLYLISVSKQNADRVMLLFNYCRFQNDKCFLFFFSPPLFFFLIFRLHTTPSSIFLEVM